ncbi:MAG: AI-2E family transporter [Kineosporiaceae bacterium]
MSPWKARIPRSTSLRAVRQTVAARRAAVQAERTRRVGDPWEADRLAAEQLGLGAPAQSDRVSGPDGDEAVAAAGDGSLADALPPLDALPADPTPRGGVTDPSMRFGVPGLPVSRAHPFYIGFMGATGVLVASFLLGLLGRLTSVLTLVVIALFLALALDPLVRRLQGHGLSRGSAVALVFLGVVLLFVGFGFAIVPPLAAEAADITTALPGWVDDFQKTQWVIDLDKQFGIINTVTEQLKTRLANGETVVQLFGGVLGAGQAVISGAFSAFTVLVLTLYFTASLNTLTEAAYALVPASRRGRVRLIGDEIIRRIGGYTSGQVAVATINAAFTYIGLLVLGLPYALVLAITVGILGLIPMVGATIGALVIVVAALFQSWQAAVIVMIYYLIYQQVENYVIAPRIMSRTVNLPGFLAVIAALAGGALLGILGALIAIPIAASILLIVQEVIIPRQQRQ